MGYKICKQTMTYLSTRIHPQPSGCTFTHTRETKWWQILSGQMPSPNVSNNTCTHVHIHPGTYPHMCIQTHIHTHTHTHTRHWNTHTHTLLFVRSQFIPEVSEFDRTASPRVTAIKCLLKPVVCILHVQLVTHSFNAWQLCCCRQPSKTTCSVHLTDCIPLHVNLPRKITIKVLKRTFVRTSYYVLPQ